MIKVKPIDKSDRSKKRQEDLRKKQTTGLWPVAFSCGPTRMLMRDDSSIVTHYNFFCKAALSDRSTDPLGALPKDFTCMAIETGDVRFGAAPVF